MRPRRQVGAVLVERQADEGLHAGEEDAALLEDVLVVERDVAQRAAALPPSSPRRRNALLSASRPDPARLRTAMDIQLDPLPRPAIGKHNLPLVVDGIQSRKCVVQPIYRV